MTSALVGLHRRELNPRDLNAQRKQAGSELSDRAGRLPVGFVEAKRVQEVNLCGAGVRLGKVVCVHDDSVFFLREAETSTDVTTA